MDCHHLAAKLNGSHPFFIYHSQWKWHHFLYNFHTHTHTRLTALFPGLPGWAGTRKVKRIWILLKQETVRGSGISWAICKSAPHSRQITMPVPHHSSFYRPDALPVTQQTASKHRRQIYPVKHKSNDYHKPILWLFWWSEGSSKTWTVTGSRSASLVKLLIIVTTQLTAAQNCICIPEPQKLVFTAWVTAIQVWMNLHTFNTNNNDRLTAFDPGQPG